MPRVKPYRGKIKDWGIYNGFAFGTFVDHPVFAFKNGYTSRIVDYDCESGLIETLNSRYFLVGKEWI